MAGVDALELLTPENSTRVSASALPADVWHTVFNLVRATAQTALALVNHTCLEVYRAKRYRALHLEDYSPNTKRLVRLLGDQHVANLVREVYIRPWNILHESRPKKHHLASRFWLPPETTIAARLVGLRLPALDALHVELCIPQSLPNAMYYLENVRLFITNVEYSDHPHLRALEVGVTPTSVPFDLSTFFRHLGPFHVLDTFELSIPFNGVHLRDVSGLRAFLFAHAHRLHRLAFRTRRMTPAAAQSNTGWVLVALRGMCFTNLVSAELALRPVAGPFDIDGLGGWIRAHAVGLLSVALMDRQLALDEVSVIVGALDKEVVLEMKLRVRRLSAPMLETVARGLPQLCELEITYISIGSTDEGLSGVAAFLRALSLARESYEGWHLRRLRLRLPFTVLDESSSESRLFVTMLPKLVPSFKSTRIQVG
ncbi:hypothetical protein GGF50DRAFT_109777 [Schizophyllum commune]